jgi:hypothetical protein
VICLFILCLSALAVESGLFRLFLCPSHLAPPHLQLFLSLCPTSALLSIAAALQHPPPLRFAAQTNARHRGARSVHSAVFAFAFFYFFLVWFLVLVLFCVGCCYSDLVLVLVFCFVSFLFFVLFSVFGLGI